MTVFLGLALDNEGRVVGYKHCNDATKINEFAQLYSEGIFRNKCKVNVYKLEGSYITQESLVFDPAIIETNTEPTAPATSVKDKKPRTNKTELTVTKIGDKVTKYYKPGSNLHGRGWNTITYHKKYGREFSYKVDKEKNSVTFTRIS